MTDEEYKANVDVIPTKAKKIEKWVGALLRAAPKVKGANQSEAEVCCGRPSTLIDLVGFGRNKLGAQMFDVFRLCEGWSPAYRATNLSTPNSRRQTFPIRHNAHLTTLNHTAQIDNNIKTLVRVWSKRCVPEERRVDMLDSNGRLLDDLYCEMEVSRFILLSVAARLLE